MDNLYAVVDIETAGNFSSGGGIAEIAIVVTNGKEIIQKYETLVNPNTYISPFVQNLTGITNEMVRNAPQFNEVALDIYSILKDKVFVAHNVNFDYKYVKHQLELAGYKIGNSRLCTIRLSRKIIPNLPSYSLGNITKTLGIQHKNKHRAMADTMATADLFILLFNKNKKTILDALKQVKKTPNLPANLPKKVFDSLPEKTGVYYFYNNIKEIIYIGKAKNIKKRISNHFSGKATAQKLLFYREVFDVSVELTGTQLVASLLEDSEIKHHWPIYNRTQKSKINKFGVFYYENQKGISQLGITKIKHQIKPLKTFPSLSESKNWLIRKVEEFKLKPQLCNMPEFDSLNIDLEQHQINIKSFIKEYDNNSETYILKGKGRVNNEISFVYIKKGMYKGFGFIRNKTNVNMCDVENKLISKHESITTKTIINAEKFNEQITKIVL